jgi:hypothetical protein
VQRLPATSVDVANGGANLGVGVAVDLFLEEVDQAPVALQDGQNTQVRARRRARE